MIQAGAREDRILADFSLAFPVTNTDVDKSPSQKLFEDKAESPLCVPLYFTGSAWFPGL